MKISSSKQTSSKDRVVSSMFVLPANYEDYCPHCCNRSLKGVGDGRAVCDSCGEEYELMPLPNNRVKLLPIESSQQIKSAKDATWKTDKRLAGTSERYKGYLIVLDLGGDGYNVYDKHRELEDAGYPSKEAAKQFIDELVANGDVYSAESLVDSTETFDAQSYAKQRKQSSEFNKWLKRVESAISRNDTTRIKNIKESLMYMTSSQLSNKLASYLIDKLNSALTTSSDDIKSASYGGAFDIEDDQYFTKDEIVEFGNTVCDHLNETFYDTYEVSDVYMETPKKLVLTVVQKSDESEFTATTNIDMRKIKRPSDLMDRYLGTVVYALQQDIKAYNDEINDFSDITSVQKSGSDIIANTLTNQLPPAVDMFLMDIAQIHGEFSYSDIIKHRFSDSEIKQLQNLRRRYVKYAEFDDEDKIQSIIDNVNKIVLGDSLNASVDITAASDVLTLDTKYGDSVELEDGVYYVYNDEGELVFEATSLESLKSYNIRLGEEWEKQYGSSVVESAVDTPSGYSHSDALNERLWDAAYKYMESLGYYDDEIRSSLIIDVQEQPDRRYVDLRAELNYDELTGLLDVLDPIVQECDANAYFEPVAPGIAEAYVYNTSDVSASTKLKRIARYSEFDNGHVLHDWKEMTDEEAEEVAKQMSLKNPDDIYYVAYDNLMDSSSDKRWVNGESYPFEQVSIKYGKPFIQNDPTLPSSQNISAAIGNVSLKQVAANLRKYIKDKTGIAPAYPSRTVPNGYQLQYFGNNPMSDVVKKFNENSNDVSIEAIVDVVNEFSELNNIEIQITTKLDSWDFEVICITILHDPTDFVPFDTAVNKLGRYVARNFPELSRVKWKGMYADHYLWMWEGDYQICSEAADAIAQLGAEFGVEFETEIVGAHPRLEVTLRKPISRPLSAI